MWIGWNRIVCRYFRTKDEFEREAFEKACGVGVVYTNEDVQRVVAKVLSAQEASLKVERYLANLPQLLLTVRKELEWCDGKTVKDEFDKQILELLGPVTEADLNAKKEKASKKKEQPTKAATVENAVEETQPVEKFENIEDMYVGRELKEARNTEQMLIEVKSKTGGKLITRFPPEPNGFLHLGHAKSMRFNFGLASRTRGECILRFDDTNPEAESIEYIESIIESVAFMGHKPVRTTYSSDYFPELYELAIKMIKKGFAYVDHQTKAEIEAYREKRQNSPWRDRPVEENLRLFEDMRKGKFSEGAATLRMKGDMSHPNPCMWDMIAYRIKYTPHPHAGEKWCIYPSYDYTHCIIDSLEYITYSLCTLEFEVRRDTYYWLLDILDLYKPMVWEFSRLNLSFNVLSKRRLLALVRDHHVRGWDDPRLLTINGLRRRGYTADAINDFCDRVGVSRNEQHISNYLLEQCLRIDLDKNASRAMAVLEPLKITLKNYPADKVEEIQAPLFPKDESLGFRSFPFSRVVYIERSDFKEEDNKNFFGLSVGKEVHLKYAYNIKCEEIVKDKNQHVVELICTVDLKNVSKCKGNIHWVAEPAPGVKPLTAEVRLYDTLFLSENPAAIDNWVADLNPNSLVVVKNVFLEPSLKTTKHLDKYQFERVGFFVTDFDSTESSLVFNRSVKLKESKDKNF